MSRRHFQLTVPVPQLVFFVLQGQVSTMRRMELFRHGIVMVYMVERMLHVPKRCPALSLPLPLLVPLLLVVAVATQIFLGVLPILKEHLQSLPMVWLMSMEILVLMSRSLFHITVELFIFTIMAICWLKKLSLRAVPLTILGTEVNAH